MDMTLRLYGMSLIRHWTINSCRNSLPSASVLTLACMRPPVKSCSSIASSCNMAFGASTLGRAMDSGQTLLIATISHLFLFEVQRKRHRQMVGVLRFQGNSILRKQRVATDHSDNSEVSFREIRYQSRPDKDLIKHVPEIADRSLWIEIGSMRLALGGTQEGPTGIVEEGVVPSLNLTSLSALDESGVHNTMKPLSHNYPRFEWISVKIAHKDRSSVSFCFLIGTYLVGGAFRFQYGARRSLIELATEVGHPEKEGLTIITLYVIYGEPVLRGTRHYPPSAVKTQTCLR